MVEEKYKHLRTGLVSPLGLLLALILYIAANTLVTMWFPTMRLDATEEGLYTLSDGTHKILARVDEPIMLHYFFSELLGREVPFYASYARRVRELLTEIEAAANGKVVLLEHNPEPFSDAEELAVSHGVQGIPVDQGRELAYFGLSGINSVDEIELIPFFQTERENLLEYDLVQMIYTLSNVEPPVVGVMSSLPVMGDMNVQLQGGITVPWAIAKKLRANFNVINLPESIDDLPDSIDVMMVVHPLHLSERTLYQLEQFLFRGGRALFFIDPKSEPDLFDDPDDVSTSASGVRLLFDHWGIRVPEGQLVGDRTMALRINAGTVAQPIPAEYLIWLNITRDNMDQNDPATSNLPAINLASAGYIDLGKDSLLALQPLVFSSSDSSPIAVKRVRGSRPDILGLLDDFKPDDHTYVMAGRLSGELVTAFRKGPPQRMIPKTAQETAEAPDPVQLMKSSGPINIIIVADSDMLKDRFWIRKQQFFGREVEEQIASNADLVVNALSNLVGSDELLTLRSRGVSQRPFETVIELRQQAESRLQQREQELQDKLSETQEKIAEFEGIHQGPGFQSPGVVVSLSHEQRAELARLRNEMLAVRKQLRTVQTSLREEVETLEGWLQFLNIGMVPMLIAVIGMIFGIPRITRRRRYAISSPGKIA